MCSFLLILPAVHGFTCSDQTQAEIYTKMHLFQLPFCWCALPRWQIVAGSMTTCYNALSS